LKIEDWTNKIHNGHVVDILKEMPSRSIDVACTSPPYWGLRDYGQSTSVVWGGNSNCEHEWNIGQGKKINNVSGNPEFSRPWREQSTSKVFTVSNICSKCGAWKGQLGLEPHPQMYIDHLVTIFREVKRVLKDSGSFWLNLGDSYYGGKGDPYGTYLLQKHRKGKISGNDLHKHKSNWLQSKQKMLIPERVAIALQEDGWVLRNDIIWYKPNHMPSSVKDRLTSSYEHVFFFVKSRKYYFDLDSIRVPHTSIRWGKNTKYESKHSGLEKQGYSELGKNPGDMWIINTKPFKGAHFAVFPTTLIEKIIKCAGPKGGIVLDTFIGSGTTGVVAKLLGLNFIGIELNPEYCKIASKRIGNIPIIKFERKKVVKKEEKKVNWEKMFDVST